MNNVCIKYILMHPGQLSREPMSHIEYGNWSLYKLNALWHQYFESHSLH